MYSVSSSDYAHLFSHAGHCRRSLLQTGVLKIWLYLKPIFIRNGLISWKVLSLQSGFNFTVDELNRVRSKVVRQKGKATEPSSRFRINLFDIGYDVGKKFRILTSDN